MAAGTQTGNQKPRTSMNRRASSPISIPAKKQELSNPFHGVCEFHFQRADAESRPTVINGFSADLPDGRPTKNNECQVSEALLPFEEAFPIARHKA